MLFSSVLGDKRLCCCIYVFVCVLPSLDFCSTSIEGCIKNDALQLTSEY